MPRHQSALTCFRCDGVTPLRTLITGPGGTLAPLGADLRLLGVPQLEKVWKQSKALTPALLRLQADQLTGTPLTGSWS